MMGTDLDEARYPDGWFDPERNAIDLNRCTVYRSVPSSGGWRGARTKVWDGELSPVRQPACERNYYNQRGYNPHDRGREFKAKTLVGTRTLYLYERQPDQEPIPF